MPQDADPLALPMQSESGWAPQRTAAATNRQAILDAAQALVREHGAAAVDIRDIAKAAGVGVGTVYRRFGDKGSLIAAVIDDQERELQNELLSGPAPLGPGAPPRERMHAFLGALAALTERDLDLLSASEGSSHGARYKIGAYGAWRLHLSMLLRQLGADDPAWSAELLLGALDTALYRHQRRERGASAQVLLANLHAAADRLTAGDATVSA